MTTDVAAWASQLRRRRPKNGVLLAALRLVSPDHAKEIAAALEIDESNDPEKDQEILSNLGMPDTLVNSLKLPGVIGGILMPDTYLWPAWIVAALAVVGWYFSRRRKKSDEQLLNPKTAPTAQIHPAVVSNRYRLGLVVEAQSLGNLQATEQLSLERVLPLLRSAKYFICRRQLVANALALQLGAHDFDRASRAFVYVGIDFETQDTGIDAVGFRGALEQRLTSAAGFAVVVVRELLAVQGLQNAGFIQV